MAVIELVDRNTEAKKIDKPKKVEAENKEKTKAATKKISSAWQKSSLSIHKHIIHELIDGLATKSNIYRIRCYKDYLG